MVGTAEVNAQQELAEKFVSYTSRHVFLTGKAGTGKTTFLRKLMATTFKKAIIVAPTGIAAINAMGTTIHSQFQLPFGAFLPEQAHQDLGQEPPCHFNTGRTLAKHLTMPAWKRKVLQELELLVIDEVSMLRADMLDAIDFVLRYIRRSQAPFGGVQLLLIGDLSQLPPVVKNTEWTAMQRYYPSAFFFDALVLQKTSLVRIELEKIYRQDDERFIGLLNNLRNNLLTPDDNALLMNYFDPQFTPDGREGYITLTTHNAVAAEINQKKLAALNQKQFVYGAQITGDFPESAFPAEVSLELKLGAQIMFIKNDPSPAKRFFNGKIGFISHLDDTGIEVTVEGVEEPFLVETYTWKNQRFKLNERNNEMEEEVIGTFTQYPLRLAWAITVHKSQGLTFEKAVIDIGNAFAPGQIYVALSRLRSLKGLVLTSMVNQRAISTDRSVDLFQRRHNEAPDPGKTMDADRQNFLRSYLLNALNFALPCYVWKTHADSYDSETGRSTKQKFADWAKGISDEIEALRIPADKFLVQLQQMFAADTPDLLSLVAQRTEAAAGYFIPRLEVLSEKVLDHIDSVKTAKQVKGYLAELADAEMALYDRILKIERAAALSNSLRDGLPMAKDLDARRNKAREVRMENVLRISGTEKIRPGDLKKAKKQKTPKIDTRAVTLDMYREGLSVKEIAAKRNLAESTIESYLCRFVASSDVDASSLIPKERLHVLEKAIVNAGTRKLGELKALIGGNYSYFELKVVLAHLEANPQAAD